MSKQDPVRQQAQILAELQAAGYEDLESVYQLQELDRKYESAVPILVSWLPRVVDYSLKDSIMRDLAVPFAKQALKPLIDAFVNMDTSQDPTGWRLWWVAGNAIEVIWDDQYFDELREICLNRDYGRGREMVIRGMAKSKHPEAGPTLIKLLDDPAVPVPAIIALRRVRPHGARHKLEEMRPTQERWIQKEIDKTLAKLPAD